MYCILVTGIPAAGKSTIAKLLSEKLDIPMISKDSIKELLFDEVGFTSRAEKVKLGVAGADIMYYVAEQLMSHNLPFILENNFENTSRDGLNKILQKYSYKTITVTLTGDYRTVYERFVNRNNCADRHRGHVVNDCYPEKEPCRFIQPISYESYEEAIISRGMDAYFGNGPHIVVDTTDFAKVDKAEIVNQILMYREQIKS
jgi:predicted kinase